MSRKVQVYYIFIIIKSGRFCQEALLEMQVDKPENEQGKYLHPEAYNLGEEYDIHYEQHQQMKEKEEQRKVD